MIWTLITACIIRPTPTVPKLPREGGQLPLLAPAGQDVVYEVDQAGAVTKYARPDGMLIAKVVCSPSCAMYCYLGDHLGSTRQVSSIPPETSSSPRATSPSGRRTA